jgi:hypothetical protein
MLALIVLAAVGMPSAGAGEARDYAYLYLQGKISESRRGRPVGDATVRLVAGSEVIEVRSDARGAFRFDKLPVKTYELEILTAQGEVIRRVRRFDTANLELTMLDLRVGRTRRDSTSGIVVEAEREQVEIAVPEPRTRWDRFGNELLIFLGVAGLLAL